MGEKNVQIIHYDKGLESKMYAENLQFSAKKTNIETLKLLFQRRDREIVHALVHSPNVHTARNGSHQSWQPGGGRDPVT